MNMSLWFNQNKSRMKILKLTSATSERRLFFIMDQIACIADDNGNSEITLISGEKLLVLEECDKILLKIVELLDNKTLVMC